MENNSFKVYSSKRNKLISIVLFLLLEILALLLIAYGKYITLAIVNIVIITLIFLFIFSNEFLFQVCVSQTDIKVRTGFGRKYKFNVSDINKVECERTDSTNSGTHFYIIVITETEKLQMSASLTGFDTMAGYLLDKYQTGEINQKAISRSCQKTLVTYKNNEYMPKKRCKKGKHQDESE